MPAGGCVKGGGSLEASRGDFRGPPHWLFSNPGDLGTRCSPHSNQLPAQGRGPRSEMTQGLGRPARAYPGNCLRQTRCGSRRLGKSQISFPFTGCAGPAGSRAALFTDLPASPGGGRAGRAHRRCLCPRC